MKQLSEELRSSLHTNNQVDICGSDDDVQKLLQFIIDNNLKVINGWSFFAEKISAELFFRLLHLQARESTIYPSNLERLVKPTDLFKIYKHFVLQKNPEFMRNAYSAYFTKTQVMEMYKTTSIKPRNIFFNFIKFHGLWTNNIDLLKIINYEYLNYECRMLLNPNYKPTKSSINSEPNRYVRLSIYINADMIDERIYHYFSGYLHQVNAFTNHYSSQILECIKKFDPSNYERIQTKFMKVKLKQINKLLGD